MTLPFGNDTEKFVRRLAARSMQADKRRNVFVIVTIALAVCLMGTMGFVHDAKRVQVMEEERGQYQAGCSGISREEVERLVNGGRFEKWGYTVDGPRVRYEDCNLAVSFVNPGMIDLMGYGSVTGAYPQSPREICAERTFLDTYGLPKKIGDTITLNLGDGESAYTLSGILEKENVSREFVLWISESAAFEKGEEHCELRFRFADSREMDTEQLQADIGAFFEEMGISADRTFYSSNYFNMAEFAVGNRTAIYVLMTLVAVICSVVIYNIFYISVMGKMREYGRLKVLGATPKQLKSVVKRQRSFLAAMAIPPGLVAAAVITMISMPGCWSWRNNMGYALIVVLFAWFVILVSTRKPLKLVGKVSAIEAVRSAAYTDIPGRGVSGRLRRSLTMPYLAAMNFGRSRKKAFVTSLSLSLTGILLLCVSAYANSIDSEEMARAQHGDRSNYLLQYENYLGEEYTAIQKENPLGETLQEQLLSLPGVDYITAYDFAAVRIPEIMENETFYVTGFDSEEMSAFYTDDMILGGSANHEQLLAQDGILLCTGGNTFEVCYGCEYKIGDRITVVSYDGQTKTYTVMGIVKDVRIGSSCHFFILPAEELAVLYPETLDFTGYLNIHAEKDGRELRTAVFDTVKDQRIEISVRDDLAVSLEASLQDEMKLYYGLLVFAFVFALINLANTLITNLLTRQQELGIFQSVGMSNSQLVKMLSFECLCYVGIALAATLSVGTVCSMIVCRVFDQVGIYGNVTYHFPVMAMLLFAGALFVVQGVFCLCVIRYCGKLSLVERIKAAE